MIRRTKIENLYALVIIAFLMNIATVFGDPTTGYYPQGTAFPPKTCGTGQFIMWGGVTWSCSSISGGGGVIGTGIATHLTKWNTTTGVNASIMTESGTTVTVPTTAINIGNGAAAGPPTAKPVAVAGTSGNVTGSVRYAFTETFGSGETTIGPISDAISVTNKAVGVSGIGPPRRGESQRKLYRSDNSDPFKLVYAFDGGGQYFQTTVTDNVATGSRGATAPSVDTSAVWNLTIDDSVKTWRSSPANGSGPADVTVLTGDPSVAGAYAMDIYNTVFVRSSLDDTLALEKTGDSGYIIDVIHRPITADDASQTRIFTMGPDGIILAAPLMTNADFGAFGIQATTAATPTQATGGINSDITPSGSNAQLRYSISGGLKPGYTGSTETAAVRGANNCAGTGGNAAVRGDAYGTGNNTAVEGVAQLGSTNVAGYFGTDGLPDPHSFSGAVIANTGASGADMIIALTNGAIKFEVGSGGFVYIYEIIIDSSAAPVLSSCGSSSSISGGSNGGWFQVGTGTTSCTMTLAHAPGKGCTITDRSRSVTYSISSNVVTLPVVVALDIIDYGCHY